MAAGLGFKTFNTGDVLSAADVNGYLMQGVLVFADATARNAAITSPQEGQFAYLKDTNITTYYTGSAWANLDTTGMTNPMTTTGDTIYSSSGSTPARLGIGTAGQVLTVNAGATAPEWKTASGGGGMTLISRTSFSNVASQAFNGVFTSTYDTYFVSIDEIYAATSSDDLLWQFQYSTSTVQAANYYATCVGWNYLGDFVGSGSNNASAITLSTHTGGSGDPVSAQLYVNQVGNASEYAVVSGMLFNNPAIRQQLIGGEPFEARTYTGFLLKTVSTNITGTVSIFGVNKS